MSIHKNPKALPLVDIELCEYEHAAFILTNSTCIKKITGKHNAQQGKNEE